MVQASVASREAQTPGGTANAFCDVESKGRPALHVGEQKSSSWNRRFNPDWLLIQSSFSRPEAQRAGTISRTSSTS